MGKYAHSGQPATSGVSIQVAGGKALRVDQVDNRKNDASANRHCSVAGRYSTGRLYLTSRRRNGQRQRKDRNGK